MWEDDDLDWTLSNALGLIEHSFRALQTSQPLSKVEVDDKFVTVVFDLPGVKRDEVQVTCTEEMVSVDAEVARRSKTRGGGVSEGYARYSKQVRLPVRVVASKGTARFRNGMIIVKVPRYQERRGLRDRGKRLKLTA